MTKNTALTKNRECVNRHATFHLKGLPAPSSHSTSLTPYGTAFWALILAACGGGGGGGGGGGTPTFSGAPIEDREEATFQETTANKIGGGDTKTIEMRGRVIDGPVEGASLFLLRPDHVNSGPVKIFIGTSGPDGNYTTKTDSNYAGYILYADLANAIDHGEDLASSEDNIRYDAGEFWRAPAGSAIISPLTEILGRVHGFTPTPGQKAAFSKSLGLPTDIDVTQDDPLSAEMAAHRQKLFTLGRIANDILRELGDTPLNAGQTGQAYLDEINRLYARETQTPDKEPPSPEQPQQVAPKSPEPAENMKPGAVALSRSAYELNEGNVHFAALTRITIIDDGLGNVGLAALPQNSIFEYRSVAARRGVYDLYLKSGVKLDDSMVGIHSVTIKATGDGASNNPAPATFTLTVRNIEHDPVITRLDQNTLSIDETVNSAAADTGLRFDITDRDGNLVVPPILSDDRFALRQSGQEWHLWVKSGQNFISGEKITLTITARDSANRTDTETIRVTINDIEHAPKLSIIRPAQPVAVPETIGNNITQSIDTGITVRASDRDNNLRPLVIESMQGGIWQVDDRFEISGTSLLIKSGQQFNFEDTDNPGGLIRLRITASDTEGNSVHRKASIQLTNVDEPTMVRNFAISGLVNGSASVSTVLTARVDASDPDTRALGFSYGWFHQDDKKALSNSASFTPDRPGRYTLSILVKDGEFDDVTWLQQEFTVPQPEVSIQPPEAPGVPDRGQAVRFFSTENGRFVNNAYEFSLSENAGDYQIIGKVFFGDHADPAQASGRTLYTLGGPHHNLLRLASDGVLRLGDGVDLDAAGIGGLAELRFTIAALFLPNNKGDGNIAYSRTAVSRVEIFDPLNPPNDDPAPPPARSEMLAIHENHPLTKPVIDLDGTGIFALAPTGASPDNQFFRIDAATGKIWFQPLDANGDGVNDAGDYPLLDFEDPRDVGGDGTYELQIIRTAPGGAEEVIDLALTVQDLGFEVSQRDERGKIIPQQIIFRYMSDADVTKKEKIAGLLDDWFAKYKPDLSASEVAKQKTYVKYLLNGTAFKMPTDGSKLVMTWSIGGALFDQDPLEIEPMRAKIVKALEKFETFLNFETVEVEETAQSNAMMTVYFEAAEIFVNRGGFKSNNGFVIVGGKTHYHTILHEIGHALGLGHPFGFAGGGRITPPEDTPAGRFPRNPNELDSLNSVMTYGDDKHLPDVITKNDINALQFIYGIPGTDYYGLYASIADWFVDDMPTNSAVLV